jgi:hypothetical protein
LVIFHFSFSILKKNRAQFHGYTKQCPPDTTGFSRWYFNFIAKQSQPKW